MKKGFFLGALLFAAGFVVFACWFLFTSRGLDLFLASFSRLTPVKIAAGAASGRLADAFELHDVRVRIPEGPVSISIGDLKLAWRPAGLLGGVLIIKRFELDDVVLNDDHPETKEPVSLKWPRLSGFLVSFEGWIKNFAVHRLVYNRSGHSLFSVDRLACRIAWRFGIGTVADAALESPLVSVRGTGETGFSTPFLKADLTLALPGRKDLDRLAFKADLNRSRAGAGEEMAGPASLTAAPTGKPASLSGRLAVSPHEIALGQAVLRQAEFAGQVGGEGKVLFREGGESLAVRVRLKNVRRASGLGSIVGLTGAVEASGDTTSYKGSFDLAAARVDDAKAPWQKGSAAGAFTGNLERVRIMLSRGVWLGGRLAGNVEAQWKEGLHVLASLRVRDLNPAQASPDWNGRINANLDAKITRSTAGAFSGSLDATLPESSLRGRQLSGTVKATVQPGATQIDRLDLHGKGFDIAASGVLEQRLTFQASVSDLSGLLPGAGGRFEGNGWFSMKGEEIAGSVKGKGGAIRIGENRVGAATFAVALGSGGRGAIAADVEAQGVSRGSTEADRVDLHVTGTRDNHAAALALSRGQANLHLALLGGLREREWQGSITGLRGSDPQGGPWKLLEAPVPLRVSADRLTVHGLRLASVKGEALGADADLFFTPLHGDVSAMWQRISLARLQPFLASGKLDGASSGDATVHWPAVGRRTVDARMSAQGAYRTKGLLLPLRAQASAAWDERGVAARWEIATDGGGKASGMLTAAGHPELSLPTKATVSASWEGIDVALLRPWLPQAFSLKGRFEGQVDGTLLPDRIVAMTGHARVVDGRIEWASQNGSVSAAIENGSAGFTWSGRALAGQLHLALANYGSMTGSFSLPLPAQLPPAFLPRGPLTLALDGEIREQGLISAALPGLMQETKGIMTVEVRGGGVWEKPQLTGSAVLKDASVFLPSAGVHLEKIRLEAQLSGDALHVSRIRAESGGGWIEAAGDGRLQQGELRYEGTLRGKDFQALNLPDLRVYASPDVSFHGDRKLFSARGEIAIPQLALYGTESENVIRPSSDVVIADVEQRKKKSLPLDLDVQVRVILGEKARIEARGIEARLAGSVDVAMTGLDKVLGHGVVRLVDGTYKTYGIRLTITRGNIVFNGPLDRPTLDVLAVRKTEDVTAGVEVMGTTVHPVVNLYANRSMTDADKLAYIVLGHPLSTSESNQSTPFTGAGDIFQGGATPTMTSEARRRLGLEGPPGTTPRRLRLRRPSAWANT